MTKSVVVLGGNGFLGTHVIRAFLRAGYAVRTCSRETGVDARVEGALDAFLERSKPDFLANCAAHGGGIAYNAKHPVALFEDNLLIGFHAVRAAARSGVRKFINIMGNSTYPGALDLHSEANWWDGPLHPSVIASAIPRKAQWVHAWALRQQSEFRSIHLILPNLYGPGDHLEPERSHALLALIRKIWEAKESGASHVEIWGTGKPVREWLYVEDAAEGIIRAAERYDAVDVLNLGNGVGCTIRELAETIADMLGWKGEFVFDATRPDGAPRKVADISRMREALGWVPATSLRDGIAKTLAWFDRVRGDSLSAVARAS